MLSSLRLLALGLFLAGTAPTSTQSLPPGASLPPAHHPAPDEIVQRDDVSEVLVVTDRVKKELEARPGWPKLRIALRGGATDADLATLAAKLPWLENLLVIDAPKLTSLAPIAKLPRLRALHLNGNGATTLAPLAGHPALESLTMTCGSGFTDSDLSALAAVKELQSIQLRSCRTIADAHGLERLARLRALVALDTPLAKIDALAGHASLASFVAPGNRISDLRPLAGLSELVMLDLAGSPATDFTPLRGLAKLRFVTLSSTSVTDLDVLSASTALVSLTLNDAKSVSLANLPAFAGLTSLYLGGTHVTDLAPLASLPALEYVSFDRTPVASMRPLFALARLKHVHVPTTMSDAEIVAFQAARPGVSVMRFGRPLPGAAPAVPIP